MPFSIVQGGSALLYVPPSPAEATPLDSVYGFSQKTQPFTSSAGSSADDPDPVGSDLVLIQIWFGFDPDQMIFFLIRLDLDSNPIVVGF